MDIIKKMITRFGGLRSPHIFAIAFVVLFWSLYDCIITYVTPLIMVERLGSATYMGLVIGLSSIFGAVFDFVACKFIRSVDYRRTLLYNAHFVRRLSDNII